MTNKENRKELMTAAEAVEYLSITKRSILKWARAGRIERVKISGKVVLFTAEAVENFLKQQTNGVESQTRGKEHAVRTASSPQSKRKGGVCKKSGESWRDLRQEVSSWES
jgi:excisionase family DNA binding protein